MSSIGQKIKKARKLKKFTQYEAAKKLSMSASGYSKIEQGTHDVSYTKLVLIAEVFEIELQDLINLKV